MSVNDKILCFCIFNKITAQTKEVHVCDFAKGITVNSISKEVQVGKDQEKEQSEKDSHSKNRDGKKLN